MKIRSEVFAAINDMQNLSFWKLFSEFSFCEKNIFIALLEYREIFKSTISVLFKEMKEKRKLFLHLLEKYINIDLKIFLYSRVYLKAIL